MKPQQRTYSHLKSQVCHTSVQRMTLPLALNSEPWKILTLVMDSIDFPSMGLMTLDNPTHKTTVLNKTKTRRILVHTTQK